MVDASRLWVTPLSASTPMWAFMPEYQSLAILARKPSEFKGLQK